MKSFQQKPRVLVVGGGTLAQALEKKFQPSGILTFRAGRNPGPWHLDLSRDPGCWQILIHMMVVVRQSVSKHLRNTSMVPLVSTSTSELYLQRTPLFVGL